jgi:cytochrome c-type biogenesis protein CcmF
MSVGFPYFNSVFIPLMTPLLMLMGVAPYCRFHTTELSSLYKRLWFIVLLSLAFAIALPYIFMASINSVAILGLGLALWILLSSLQYFLTFPRHLQSLGMLVAHSGVAIVLIGISLSTAYSVHQEVRMTIGDQLTVGGYQFRFLSAQEAQGPNYQTTIADILILKKGISIAHLYPEKRIFSVQNMALSKIAIEVGMFRDLYIALGEQLGDENTWSLRIYVKPFVRWIWMGGLIMILGGLLACFKFTKGKRHAKT